MSITSTSTLAEYLPSYDISENLSTLISLSGINVSNIREKENKQQKVVRELRPESGFDLNKIIIIEENYVILTNIYIEVN